MKTATMIMAMVLLIAMGASAEEKPGWGTLYDKDSNRTGYVKQSQFVPGQYELYDKDWNRKGYVKWNEFSDRYEIYDSDWNRKGSLEGGRLSFPNETETR